jgi:hypothetical protein
MLTEIKIGVVETRMELPKEVRDFFFELKKNIKKK